MRPIDDRRVIHASTDASGNLKTECGLDVKGHWVLRDGYLVTCPHCEEKENQ